VTLVLWRRRGGTATARLAGTFGLLAATVAIGVWLPAQSDDRWVTAARKLLVTLALER
jgi:hypothetical protein